LLSVSTLRTSFKAGISGWRAMLLLCSVVTLALAGGFQLSDHLLTEITRRYGADARLRAQQWRDLINQGANLPEAEKLARVNAFFNRLPFVSDLEHWGKEDYWATPIEMIASNGGDCEDFSIGKYITLKEMGVPESRMRLTYVKALRLNQAHMVVTYFPTPDADPLVLDNLVKRIVPASQRRDLLPVYSFNGEGLWLAKARGTGQRVGGSDRISLWRDLMTRMREEQQ
jgi:predicted transglutaminase-like cysteine proteinase